MRVILVVLLAWFAALAETNPALAADSPGKVALIIGNAKYPDNGEVLSEVANDARDLADELQREGFQVERAMDMTGEAMRQALQRLYGKIERDGVALLFFGGFGIQSARQTYLLPVDAQIWTEPDVARDGVNLESILNEMTQRGALVKIALIDASRRNPFERRFRRYSAGLAPAVTPTNTLALYSSALGSVVSNSRNDRGLFMTELLREIRVPNVSAEQVLRKTQAGVTSATRNEQIPWLSSSLTIDFSFAANPNKPQTKSECEPPKADGAPNPDELAKDAVIADLTRRIAADRNNWSARYRRGQIYAVRHAYALAVQDFDEALRLKPRDPETLNNRCWTRATLGQLQEALNDCNEALRLKPGFTDALDSRGLVYLKLGKFAEATQDYSESLRQNPRSVSSLFGQGIAKRRSGGDGSADLAAAKSMDPNIGKEFANYGVSECVP